MQGNDMSKMYAAKNLDQSPIFVRSGESGYWDVKPEDVTLWASMLDAQGPAVNLSAMTGAAFGWDAPGAQLAVKAVSR